MGEVMGRAGKSRGRGWNAIGDVIPVEKGLPRGSRSSFKPWRCWSSSSAPSTSPFLCLLDVRSRCPSLVSVVQPSTRSL